MRLIPRTASTGPRLLPLAAVILGVAAFAATPAQAQRGDRHESGHHRADHRQHDRHHHRDYRRGHDRHHGHHRDRHYDRSRTSVDFRISIGDRHRGHHYHRSHHQRTGYWQRVWVPPQYGYHYRPCGTRVRVLIRHGYYKQVWVSTGYSRGYSHGSTCGY